MSSGVDLSQFYETFFDEADELLADMERLLLQLEHLLQGFDRLISDKHFDHRSDAQQLVTGFKGAQ